MLGITLTSTGILTVRPVSATLFKEPSLFSKLNPYVVCIMGGFTSKTKPADNSDKNPQWSEIFTYNRANESELTIKVCNSHLFRKDEILGECKVILAELINKGQIDGFWDLKIKQEKTGKINLKLGWKAFDQDLMRQKINSSIQPIFNQQPPLVYCPNQPPQMPFGPGYPQNVQIKQEIYKPSSMPAPPTNKSLNPGLFGSQNIPSTYPQGGYQNNYMSSFGPPNNQMAWPYAQNVPPMNQNFHAPVYYQNFQVAPNNQNFNNNPNFPPLNNQKGNENNCFAGPKQNAVPVNNQKLDENIGFAYPKENEVMTDIEYQQKMSELENTVKQ